MGDISSSGVTWEYHTVDTNRSKKILKHLDGNFLNTGNKFRWCQGTTRGAVHNCTEKIYAAKAYLGLKLASTVGNKKCTVGDNKKDFFYVCFQQKEDQR